RMRPVWLGCAVLALLAGCQTEEQNDEVLGAERANPTPLVPHEHTDEAGRRTDLPQTDEPNECRSDEDAGPALRDDTQACEQPDEDGAPAPMPEPHRMPEPMPFPPDPRF